VKDTKLNANPKHQETVEDIFSDKRESNNSRFDIAGNTTIWRTHETYLGSGNHVSLWDEISREKRKQQKAGKIAEDKLVLPLNAPSKFNFQSKIGETR